MLTSVKQLQATYSVYCFENDMMLKLGGDFGLLAENAQRSSLYTTLGRQRFLWCKEYCRLLDESARSSSLCCSERTFGADAEVGGVMRWPSPVCQMEMLKAVACTLL
jgi:hypothetical protein